MTLNKKAIVEDLFRSAPSLDSEDDCAENIVVPFLLRLGYDRNHLRRKVTISGPSGRKFKKQADLVIYIEDKPALVVETKRTKHRLREEDANQALSYAQLLSPPAPYAVLTNGHQWEVYQLSADTIGGIEDLPEPDTLKAKILAVKTFLIPTERIEAAERLLVTLENREQLEAAFQKCRQVLAKEGFIAESAFDELTKILVCKFDQEKRLAESLGAFRFTSAWFSGQPPLQALNEMFTDAKLTFHVFPPNTQILIRNNNTVEQIVAALEPFGFFGFKTPLGLAGAGGDVVGSVYETFLTGTLRGDLGQYLTPRHLIEFMVELADIQTGESILDLAAGSGGFLIRAFLDMRKKIRTMKIPQEQRDQLITELVMNRLWGIEINERLTTLCRINMILHGDGYEHIYSGDSIREDIFENTEGCRVDLTLIEKGTLPPFDVILMNPPFNLPYEDSSALNRYDLGRGRTAQGSDFLMIERALRLLKPDTGRLLIIMPHGVASGTSESQVRDYLKSHCNIRGCVSLPVGCFKPFGGSNARTCILFLTKPKVHGGKCFVGQAENVGYDVTTKYYREIDDNDLPEIINYYESVKGSL